MNLRRPSLIAAAALALAPAPGAASPPAPRQEPAVLATPTGTLHGTLELPAGKGPFPVALIIAGSGPTDRNGNDFRLGLDTDTYSELAQALARNGIASLRYDKRGVGASAAAGPSEDKLRFRTYIDDAAEWGRKLRGEKRFSALIVVGHSEGSLIGMVAARLIPANGFVSIAGAGEPVQKVLLRQLRPKLQPALYRRASAIVRQLADGHTTADVPASLHFLFRPSVQPFLISWMRYDPAREMARLKLPALIVQGENDLQASVRDARLLEKADPAAKLVLIPGMNHVLKDVGTSLAANMRSYRDPELPLDPTLVDAIVQFAAGLATKGGSAHAH